MKVQVDVLGRKTRTIGATPRLEVFGETRSSEKLAMCQTLVRTNSLKVVDVRLEAAR
jgi:hypothetical protein